MWPKCHIVSTTRLERVSHWLIFHHWLHGLMNFSSLVVPIDEFFITGCTGGCRHDDNLRCSQWWKLHQHDLFVSVTNINGHDEYHDAYNYQLSAAVFGSCFRSAPWAPVSPTTVPFKCTEPCNWDFHGKNSSHLTLMFALKRACIDLLRGYWWPYLFNAICI